MLVTWSLRNSATIGSAVGKLNELMTGRVVGYGYVCGKMSLLLSKIELLHSLEADSSQVTNTIACTAC